MGTLGRYIDELSDPSRDRLIQAQDWCIAEVLGPGGQRCLIGHAEDWQALPVHDEAWRELLSVPLEGADPLAEVEVEAIGSLLFIFRRAQPADFEAYRARIGRWGAASESQIGSRFDRLCARRGVAGAVRLVKARAGRLTALSTSAGGAIPASSATRRAPSGARDGALAVG